MLRGENKALMRAMIEARRSNGCAPHLPKKYKGTRNDRKRKAINESKD